MANYRITSLSGGAIDTILDRVEDACPNLFQPRRMMSEKNGPIWAQALSEYRRRTLDSRWLDQVHESACLEACR
jgi:hypothetical protein